SPTSALRRSMSSTRKPSFRTTSCLPEAVADAVAAAAARWLVVRRDARGRDAPWCGDAGSVSAAGAAASGSAWPGELATPVARREQASIRSTENRCAGSDQFRQGAELVCAAGVCARQALARGKPWREASLGARQALA